MMHFGSQVPHYNKARHTGAQTVPPPPEDPDYMGIANQLANLTERGILTSHMDVDAVITRLISLHVKGHHG